MSTRHWQNFWGLTGSHVCEASVWLLSNPSSPCLETSNSEIMQACLGMERCHLFECKVGERHSVYSVWESIGWVQKRQTQRDMFRAPAPPFQFGFMLECCSIFIIKKTFLHVVCILKIICFLKFRYFLSWVLMVLYSLLPRCPWHSLLLRSFT